MNRALLNAAAIAALIAGVSFAGSARAQTDAAPAAPAGSAPAATAPAAPAGDATAAPKPKLKPMIVVVVTNNRSVGLVELDAAPAGGPETKKIVTKLAPGKKATVRLPKSKGCLYDLHGVYDDGTTTDISSTDLCKDGRVNLID
ncbi:MAG TPA: hypothetical protein VKS78_11300 [Roseiarcus sp.]|nr:hypothetical protein [Roseiarcus sp.]